VTSHVETIVALTRERAARWQDGATFNLHDELGRLTMSIAGQVLWGTRFPDEEALRWSVAALAQWGQYVLTHPFAPPLGVPIGPNRRARKALAIVDRQLRPVIEARWHDQTERDDVLSHLLRARDKQGQRMSRTQIFDEMRTLGAGSVESTTDSMTWTFYLLNRYPEAYERLRREVDALDGRPPTRDDLPNLPYALQVFKEALRIYPPSPVLIRAALVDTELGGYPIRKGTRVIIAPYLLHRRTDVFPDPERFDPERFAAQRERALPRGAYLPFGAGIRTCIGNHFALLEGQLVLATLAQHAKLEVLPGQPVVPELNINLRPRGGLHVRVRQRA
jgi:cytochrome P450